MRPSPDSSSIPFSLHKKKVLLGRRPRKIPLSHLFNIQGAGSRRPPRTELASPGHVSPGPSVLRSPPAIMTRSGLGPSSPRGRAERIPPRKSLSASSQALPRKAIVTQIVHPPEGRAPHARNYGTMPTPTLPPPGHRLIGDPSGWDGIRWPAYGLATRARRPRPSEKATLPVIPGFSPKAILAWIAHPPEGRAPHAPEEGTGLTGACTR